MMNILSKDRYATVIVVMLSLVFLLPGFFDIPAVDRDESRLVQSSKNILESGNYYYPIENSHTLDKTFPISAHWLQVIAVNLIPSGSNNQIWVYRLPTILGAMLSVLATFWYARAFLSPIHSILAALMVCASILFNIQARLANVDVLFVATMTIAHGSLARIWLSSKMQSGLIVVFWTAIIASIPFYVFFGPMILTLTVLGLCVLSKNWSWFIRTKPAYGITVCLVFFLTWIIVENRGFDGDMFNVLVSENFMDEMGEHSAIHGPPPITHIIIALFTFWPLSAFLIVSIPTIFHIRKEPMMIFQFSWIIPTWCVLEFIAIKNPSFMLPFLPPLAVIAIISMLNWKNIWTACRWISAVFLTLFPVSFLLFTIFAPLFLNDGLSLLGVLICFYAIILSVYSSYILITKPKPTNAVISTLTACLLIYVSIWGMVLPSLSSLWLSERLVSKISHVTSCPDPEIRSSRYFEESLQFSTNSNVLVESIEQIAIWLKEQSKPDCKIAIVEDSKWRNFVRFARQIGVEVERKAVVSGYNYSRNDHYNLFIYQKTDLNRISGFTQTR